LNKILTWFRKEARKGNQWEGKITNNLSRERRTVRQTSVRVPWQKGWKQKAGGYLRGVGGTKENSSGLKHDKP